MALNDAEEAALRGELARANTELASERGKAKATEALTGQVGTLTNQLQAERAGRAEDRALFGTIDPAGIEVARFVHSQLPEQGRAPFPDWLKGQAADPTKAHRAVAPFFQAPAPGAPPAGAPPAGAPPAGAPPAGAPPAGAPPAGGPPAGPPPMGGNRPPPPPAGGGHGGGLTLDAAKARLTELAQAGDKSKDWTAYDAERPALLARIAQG